MLIRTRTPVLHRLVGSTSKLVIKLWQINEAYLFNPLVMTVCFSVVFHVVGALFPPIEHGCALDADIQSLIQFELERKTDEPS